MAKWLGDRIKVTFIVKKRSGRSAFSALGDTAYMRIGCIDQINVMLPQEIFRGSPTRSATRSGADRVGRVAENIKFK